MDLTAIKNYSGRLLKAGGFNMDSQAVASVLIMKHLDTMYSFNLLK